MENFYKKFISHFESAYFHKHSIFHLGSIKNVEVRVEILLRGNLDVPGCRLSLTPYHCNGHSALIFRVRAVTLSSQ